MASTAHALALLMATPMAVGSAPVPPTVSEGTETLQARADFNDRMTVDVALEGTGPYHFLIDTGSQSTVVSTAVAGNLSLAPGPRVRIVGLAGEGRVMTARVDTLEFGSRAVYDLTVPLLENRHIGADGILGTDSLQGQRVLLDFTRNTVTLGDAREMGGRSGYEIVVHARKRAGRLIMTDARIDGVRVDVVVDTGSTQTVGNLALQRALRRRTASSAVLSSVTGHETAVDLGVARELKIDDLKVSNVLLAYADAPAFAELGLRQHPAIFLGMRELRLFKRVAIDFETRKILFDLPA